MMHIRQIIREKKAYLPLLLLADEQEDMIDLYLDRGDMYLLEDAGRALAVIVVTGEGDGVLEIKNLAVDPAVQKHGYGRLLVKYVAQRYQAEFQTLLVGTGDSPLTVPFYERCGFVRSHVVKGFFTDHYDHPIVEDGVLLEDMIYLKMPICEQV